MVEIPDDLGTVHSKTSSTEHLRISIMTDVESANKGQNVYTSVQDVEMIQATQGELTVKHICLSMGPTPISVIQDVFSYPSHTPLSQAV